MPRAVQGMPMNEYDQLIKYNFILISVLVDTRLWYHGTHVSKGDFSLTVQSEYGYLEDGRGVGKGLLEGVQS